ncbi:MAG: hypothetical protein J7J33_06125, partial [Caldisericia bacterium]|nr:hypothetical protein [Caldisericia bacterium]
TINRLYHYIPFLINVSPFTVDFNCCQSFTETPRILINRLNNDILVSVTESPFIPLSVWNKNCGIFFFIRNNIWLNILKKYKPKGNSNNNED